MKEEKEYKSHSEFNSESHLVAVLERGEIPYQVRNDASFLRQVSPDLRTKSVRARQAEPDLHKSLRSGFTLIELLVVVLIIGILAAVAVPQYRVTVEKTRTVNLLTLLKSLQRAQQAYYLANGEYTQDPEVLAVTYPAGSTVNGSDIVLPNKQKIVLSDTRFMAKTDQVQLQVNYSGNGSCWALDNTLSRRVCASLGKATGALSQCSLLGNRNCYGHSIVF